MVTRSELRSLAVQFGSFGFGKIMLKSRVVKHDLFKPRNIPSLSLIFEAVLYPNKVKLKTHVQKIMEQWAIWSLNCVGIPWPVEGAFGRCWPCKHGSELISSNEKVLYIVEFSHPLKTLLWHFRSSQNLLAPRGPDVNEHQVSRIDILVRNDKCL